MLEALGARLPLAVLTNKPQGHTDRLLDGLGLARYFHEVMGGDTAFGRKPAPGGLEELARRAGVPVTATVLIGDSPIDLQTARNAGCPCVLVSYGFGYRREPLHGPERVVAAAALIPGALDDLAAA
jgi:phosphoglycolate phosphatase